MKPTFSFRLLHFRFILFLCLLTTLSSCDRVVKDDVIPDRAKRVRLNPDQRTIALNQKLRIGDVLDNDTIPEASSLSFRNPRYGFLENEGYQYIPPANFVGKDSISYKVCTSKGCQTSYVLITVKDSIPGGVPCFPQANPDWATTFRNTELRYPVYLNDVVCDRFQIYAVGATAFGSVEVDEQQRVVYRPVQQFIGWDSVWYSIYDSRRSDGNWLRIRVQPDPSDPLAGYCTTQYARPDSLFAPVTSDTTRRFNIQVLLNDVICNNVCNNIAIAIVSQEGPGQAEVAPGGQAILYKAPDVGGSVTRLRYRVCATCASHPTCLESYVYIRNQ